MTAHYLNAYKDGHRWIAYCVKCGKEEDALIDTSCNEKCVDKFNKDFIKVFSSDGTEKWFNRNLMKG